MFAEEFDGSQDIPDLYPDEYFVGHFVGFDGADGRYTAIANRNADGTVSVVTMDTFQGPDGDDLYASHTWKLKGWDALTLRIWAAQREMAAEFDRLEDQWAPWIAELPCDGPFDWMTWRPWKLMRIWSRPNPLLPDLFGMPPQYPRTFGLQSAWSLPDFRWGGPVKARLDTGVRERLEADRLKTFEQVKAEYADLEKHEPIPPAGWLLGDDAWRAANLKNEVRDPDFGEPLPPDTNHGGDRLPGRYA